MPLMDKIARNTGQKQRIGILPIAGFAAMSFAALTEPMRAANLLARRVLYDTVVFSVTGHPVQSSGAMLVMPHARVGEDDGLDYLFVVAGGDPARFNDAGVMAGRASTPRRRRPSPASI